MAVARRVFFAAGVYGLIVLLPQYFLEERIGRQNPPPITHPENFYGFVGTAVAWQVLFLVLATEPRRYRPMMIPAVLEKLSFGGACVWLFAQNRLSGMVLTFGLIDLFLGALFALSYVRTALPHAAPS